MNKKQFWIRFSVMLGIVAILLTIDLVTKYFFYDKMDMETVIPVIPYLINFKRLPDLNYGASWGILSNEPLILIVLSVVFLAVFVVYYIKEENKTWLLNIAFGLLFAGSLGNLVDRIFLGGVRDFIQFDFWQTFPTFNFADVCLCVGVALFVVYLIVYFVKNAKKRKTKEERDA